MESIVTAEVKTETQNGGIAKVNMQSKCRSAGQVKAKVRAAVKTEVNGQVNAREAKQRQRWSQTGKVNIK